MEKIKVVLQSRKFWSLVASLVAIGSGVYTGSLAPDEALKLVVGALAVYSIGTAIEPLKY